MDVATRAWAHRALSQLLQRNTTWTTDGRLEPTNGIDAEAGADDTLITPGAAWVDEEAASWRAD